MRVTVVTQDTRGGVQPYAALAAGLRAAGHDVVGVAPAEHAWLFEQVGVRSLGLAGMSKDEIEAVARATGSEGRRPTMRQMSRAIIARVPEWARLVREFAAGSDIVTGGIGGSMLGVPTADALGVPWVPAHLQPIGAPTGDYPGVLAAGIPRWLGRAGNRLGHSLTRAASELPFGPVRAAAYQALGARPARHRPVGAVYGISPHVVQVPSTRRLPTLTSGYWFLDDPGATLPGTLEAFLSHPGPVISVGFGSMVAANPERSRDAILGAAGELGLRVVVLEDSGALGQVPDSDDVISFPGVPHELLFGRAVANVHHGGAGTTAAALRAGVPSVFVPFGADQPFWARRAADLGVSAGTVPESRISRDTIRRALRTAVEDSGLRGRAARMGGAIRAERGVDSAVAWFGTSFSLGESRSGLES